MVELLSQWAGQRGVGIQIRGLVPRPEHSPLSGGSGSQGPQREQEQGQPPPNFLLPRVWAVARVLWGRRARPLPETCHGKLRASDIPGCPLHSSKAQRDEGLSGSVEGSLSWEPGSPVRAPALPWARRGLGWVPAHLCSWFPHL